LNPVMRNSFFSTNSEKGVFSQHLLYQINCLLGHTFILKHYNDNEIGQGHYHVLDRLLA
jgi:hypothetical protein